MALDNIDKAELFNNFSPATDEEVAVLSQEAALKNEVKPPIGVVDYLVEGPHTPPDGSYPMGSNERPLVINYRERTRYADAPYFSRDGLPVPLESYYDKNLYGRVDRFQNVIVPRSDSSLYQQVKSSKGKTVHALDFAGQLFYMLRRNLKIATDLGAIPLTSLYTELEATAAAYGYKKSYDAKLNFIMEGFHRHLSSLPKNSFNKILIFKDYATHFLAYIASGKFDTALGVTLSAHVISTQVSPRISGICIDIAQESFSTDLKKWEKYMLDPGFSYYVRAARKYGFYVDRNAPWRLYLDLLSKPSRQEFSRQLPESFSAAEKKSLSSNQTGAPIFNRYYIRTYTLDVPLLQEAMLHSYNKFVMANPRIINSIPGTVQCPTPKFELGPRRQRTTLAQVMNLGHHYWCGLYYDIREREQEVKYPGRRDAFVNRASKIARAYDERQAWIFINNLFKPYLYEELLFKRGLTSRPT